jgi:anti-sigma regulatory factor (Ser/Thr protein kinase)
MTRTRDAIRSTIEAAGDASMAKLLEATQLTRPGVLYHLNQLIAAGEVEYAGPLRRGRSVRYQIAYNNRWKFPIGEVETEHRLWEQLRDSILNSRMTRPAREIHTYVFGEIVNNVLEHSSSPDLSILHRTRDDETRVSVRDTGVGIFDHIAAAAGFTDRMSSVRKLQTGGYTTSPEGHTGQGVFFSSRAADQLSINSGGIEWATDNLIPDQTLRTINVFGRGTTVTWQLEDATNRSLVGLFESFSILDEDEIPQFAATAIAVAATTGTADYVTRSAARELLQGKDQFRVIVLDFSGVTNIGQGFADEVFRVFPANSPDVTVSAINMNEAVSWFVTQAQADHRRGSRDRP